MTTLRLREGPRSVEMRRRLLSCTASLRLPILRLPTTVFPLHPVSLPVVLPNPNERPPIASLTTAQAEEIGLHHGGKLALLADGATAGVMVNISSPSSGVDRELRTGSAPWEDGMLVHAVGGKRLTLLQTAERTSAGGRIAEFSWLADDALARQQQSTLDDEAVVARALLEASAARGDGAFDLMLCTLDEEIGMPDVHPSAHPLFLRYASQPEDPIDLAFWCAARLPLTTALRHHLLAVTCPLKRLVDVVDAMRLLLEPNAQGSARARRGGGANSKLRVVYDTAEASGCELEPPRLIIDWSSGSQPEGSRY